MIDDDLTLNPWCPACHRDAEPSVFPCDACHQRRVAWMLVKSQCPIGPGRPIPELPPVILHVFFLSVEETPEHLARLRGRDPTGPARAAKSRLTKSLLANIKPIDATAARVVPQS